MILILCLPAVTAAAGEQAAIVKAEKYYRSDKRQSFNAQVKHIAADSVYQPLVRYWQSVFALRRNKPQAAIDYIQTAGNSVYLQGQARRKLLEYYAEKKQWDNFSQYADGGGVCAEHLKLLRGKAADKRAIRDIWQKDSKMNTTLCMLLYRHAHSAGILSKDDVWIKLRGLAGDKKLSASRRLLTHFRGLIAYSKVRSVANRAVRYIKGKHGLSTRAQRELVMIAAMAAARKSPKTAIRRWHQFSRYFSAAENDHVWTAIATWAARWHRDDALALFGVTSGTYADEQTRGWHVRAALRAQNYALVLEVINTMPPSEQRITAWRYWRAVALQKQGETAAGNEHIQALAAEEDDFYGLLAREAINATLIESPPPPSLAGVAIDDDFHLAIALHQARLSSLARAIWRHAARRDTVSDTELMAAARYAEQAQWPLASIDAANRSAHSGAHHLRYPILYRQHIAGQSEKRQLDTAFVYALIRQESRFMPNIVSSAKAQGLMQVIPRTARQVARRNGYSKYHISRLKRVDTNVTIGTTYIRTLADTFAGSPVKVAAGYNAGPARVARWYKASPDLLITIENIPLTETRLYVKYLLANRLHYTARLGGAVPAMRDNIVKSVLTI